MKNLKCKFWLYTAKKNKGASPLHFRILVNGKKVETSLGIQLKENEWDDKKEKVKSTNPYYKSLNTRIETIEAAFHKAIEQLIDIGDALTPIAVKNLVFPKVSIENESKPKVSTLKQLTTEFLQSIKRSNEHTDGTYKRYRTMSLRFSEYIHHTLGMHDIDLASLRFTHLQGYENEIANRYDVNTVIRYVKGVKMLINYGIKEGYLEFNPFIKHKSRKGL